ncbi:MAG: DUF3638 domain-containing protein [Parachlamydiaceae bacterium]|nr:DUF3638 domain-containing protein [Parachlamydiaceae bacterium]
MNVSGAKALLTTLAQRRDSALSIESQIATLFVPKLFGSGVVAFDSLHGRLALIIHRNRTQKEKERQVKLVFATAVSLLQQDTKAFHELFPLDAGIALVNLSKRLGKLDVAAPKLPYREEYLDTPPVVTTCSRKDAAKGIKEIRKLSLIHDPTLKTAEQLTLDNVEVLFGEKQRPEAFFASLTKFLDDNQEYAAKYRHERMELLQRGKAFDARVTTQLFPQNIPQVRDAHQESLRKLAAQLAEEMKAVASNKNWAFTGHYGSKTPARETMQSLLTRMPDSFMTTLPPTVVSALKRGDLPEVVPMLREAIKGAIAQGCDILPEQAEILDNWLVSALLPNESRSLGRLGKVLPGAVGEGLRSWLTQGLIGNCMEFATDEETRSALLMAAQAAAKVKKGGLKTTVEGLASELASEYVDKPLDGVDDRINGGIAELLEKFTTLIPRPVLEASGLAASVASGQYVLEFVAHDNVETGRSYTLFVYSTGDALQYHPQDASGKTEWPMRIENISGEALDPDFFYRLLTLQTEPRCNSKYISRAADIFGENGLLSVLGGQKKGESLLRHVDPTRNSDYYMRKLMVLIPGIEDRVIFEMQLKGTIQLCKQLLEGEELVVNDAETCELLERARSSLREAFVKLEDIDVPEVVEATLEEIRLATESFRDKKRNIKEVPKQTNELPATVIENLARTLQTMGISTQALVENKATLSWVLGPEIEGFLDALSDASQLLPPIPPASRPVVSPSTKPVGPVRVAPKRGWLGTIFVSVYVQVALSVFQLVMLLTHLWSSGVSILLNPLLNMILSRITPPIIMRWYTAFMGEVQRRLGEMALHVLLHCLCNSEDVQGLKKLIGSWRSSVHDWTGTLTNTQELQLGLETAPVAEMTYFADPKQSSFDWDAGQDYSLNQLGGSPLSIYFPVPVATSRIGKDKLATILQMWVLQVDELSQDEVDRKVRGYSVVGHVVRAQIKCLYEHGDAYWNEVADPKECLEQLIQLSVRLNQSNTSGDMIGAGMVARYSLLEIMDRLARRDQGAALNGFRINVSHLLQWMKSNIGTLDDPRLVEQLQRVCHYFVPQFDLDNLPDDAELLKYAKTCLFDYSELDATGFVSLSFQTPQEFVYLKKCLEDPGVYKQLMQLEVYTESVDDDGKITYQRLDMQKLHQFQLLFILFQESLTFQVDSLINRSYALLRYHTLMSHYFAEKTRSGGEVGRTELPTFQEVLNGKKERYVTKACSITEMIRNLEGSHAVTVASQSIQIRHERYFKSNFSEKNAKRKFNQSKVIEYSFHMEGPAMQMRNRFCIESEETDRLLHSLAYFKKNLKEIIKEFVWLSHPVFSPLGLKRTLKSSPKVGLALAEFVQEVLVLGERKPEIAGKGLQLGLALKRYCDRYCAEKVIFPDFRAYTIKMMQKSLYYKNDFLVWHALTFDQKPSKKEGQLEAAVALCRALFSYNADGISTGSDTLFHREISAELRCRYLMWQTTIGELLQHKRSRAALISGVVDLFGISCSDPLAWREVPQLTTGWQFSYQGLLLDFQKCALDVTQKGQAVTSSTKLTGARNLRLLRRELIFAKEMADHPEEVKLVSVGLYQTDDCSYTAQFAPGKPPAFLRVVDGKTYFLMKPTWASGEMPTHIKEFTSECTKEGEETVAWDIDKMRFWIELTSQADRELLCYRLYDKKLIYRFSVHMTTSGQMFIRHPSSHIPLESSTAKKVHSVLYRFCKESDINCFGQEGRRSVHKLSLVSSGLDFIVEKEGETLKAYSTRFAGHYLAPQQGHVHLQKFASYLLLTNRLGEFKVVVPANEWVPNVTWRFLQGFGVFGNLINRAFSHVAEETEKPGKRVTYAYGMDRDTGHLTSDDPAAVAYLISLHLIQGDFDKADKACTHLELMCARGFVPQDILKQLYPLFIPGKVAGSDEIRQRLLSALEQNRLIHGPQMRKKKKPKTLENWYENQDKEFPLFDLLSLMNLLMDCEKRLRNPEGCYPISEFQEWYLYQRIIFCTKQMMKVWAEDSKDVMNVLGQNANLEYLLFSAGPLSARYNTLKTKFSSCSFFERSFNYSAKFLTAKGTQLPGLPGSLTSSLSKGTGYDAGKDVMMALQTLSAHCLYDARMLSKGLVKVISSTKIIADPPLIVQSVLKEFLKKRFLSYYLIARGAGKPGQKEQLQKLLPFIQGGWDAESRVLVRWLEAVCDCPLMFWSREQVINECRSEQGVIDFFKHLNFKFMGIQTVSKSVGVIGKSLVDTSVRSTKLSAFSLFNLNPMRPVLATSTLFWGSKALRAYLDTDPISARRTELAQVQRAPSFSELELIDQEADRIFAGFFDIAFEELQGEQEQKRAVADFRSIGDSEAEKERIARLNTSIADYYDRQNPQVFLKLKSRERITALYVQMTTTYTELEKSLKAKHREILGCVNAILAESGQKVSFDDLLLFFLKGDLQQCIKLTKLPLHLFHQLDVQLARYLAYYTRFQQLGRALEHVHNLSLCTDKAAQEQCIEQLADELKAQRKYSFRGTPMRELRRLMLFEFKTNKMLWTKQIGAVLELSEDSVVELLMSLGKTYFFIPTAASLLADGSRLVFVIWPASLHGTNVRLGSAQSHHVFQQIVHALSFNRDVSLKLPSLRALALLFRRAREEQHPIHMRNTDAMALRLIFIDKLNQATKLSNEKDLFALEAVIEQLAGLLLQMKELGIAIGDEAHEIFNNVQELCYPIGAPSTVPKNLYQIVEVCMRHVAQHETLLTYIRSGNTIGIEKIYEAEVVPYLAEKMSAYWQFEIPEDKRAEFVTYITGKAKEVPQWILTHKYFAEISMIKGVITILLPGIFKRSVSVDYGASKDKGVGFAKPYNGNDNVRENSSISDPIEAVVKTMVMTLSTPLSPDAVQKVLHELKVKAKQEMDQRQGISMEDTRAQKLFTEVTGSNSLLSEVTPTQLKDLHPKLAVHPETAFLYMRSHVWKQIKYWVDSLRCNALNFASLFKKQVHDTGTPFNDGSYPDHLKMMWDPGTAGEALHLIKKKCPPGGVHVLKEKTPRGILKESLNRFFGRGTQFTAYIDGGAQLRGMSNQEVAEEMLDHAAVHNPAIQAVDFFMQDPRNSGDKGKQDVPEIVMTMMKINGVCQIVPADQCNLPLSARWAYFDQVHGFGANIPQAYNGRALVLVGAKHKLYRLLQEIFRMRGIKLFKRLVDFLLGRRELDEMNLNERQTVQFAMVEEVANLISTNGIPTVEEIVAFATKNEAQMIADDNYNGYRKKVNNLVQQAVLDKIIKAKSASEMIKLFVKCITILVMRYEDDPRKVYGLVDVMIPLKDALEACQAQAIAQLESTTVFDRSDIEGFKKQLDGIKKTPMPEKIHAYSDGSKIHTDRLDHLNQQMTVQNEQEVENEREQEQEQEQELETERQMSLQLKDGGGSFKESGWDGKLAVRSLEWLKFSDPKALKLSFMGRQAAKISEQFEGLVSLKNLMGSSKTGCAVPQLYKVSALLQQSTNKLLRAVAGFFDERLYMTNNFLPRVMGSSDAEPVDIGTFGQRDLQHVLIHFEEKEGDLNILSMGCLSMHDAVLLRKQIESEQSAKRVGETVKKVMLYNPHLRIPVAGDAVDLKVLRSNGDLLRLDAQVKWLNGDVEYQKDVVKGDVAQGLLEWMEKAGIEKMEPAFKVVHAERGMGTIAGSDLGVVVAKLKKVPIAEQLYM